MLEVVRVEVAALQLEVRLHIVVKDDDFQLDALFLEQGLSGLEDLRVRGGGGADDELGGGAGRAEDGDEREGENECKNLLHSGLSFFFFCILVMDEARGFIV